MSTTDPPNQTLTSASSSSSSTGIFSFKNSTIEEVLEDLSSRFILNLPEEELVSVERICFQVEQAHWYYEDYIREEEPRFPSLPLKAFSRALFDYCPLLIHWSPDHDQAFQDFIDYKTTVPVCGAIMLNPSWTKCVLVKGWKSNAAWSFPRGKINLDEPEHVCAAREVMEETGYDISDKIIQSAVIRITVKDQKMSLFVIPNIPEDTVFVTQTRKEISKIEWFNLTDLPAWKKGVKSPLSHKFYAISSFVGPLRSIIKKLRSEQRPQHESSAPPIISEPAWPADPAIISTSRPPDKDHLSRLLGGLGPSAESTPALQPSASIPISIAASHSLNDGPLPTPQPTPSQSAAIKNDIDAPKPRSTAAAAHHVPSNISIPVSFSSPTPPQSSNSLKSAAIPQSLPEAQPKPKFEFISPFDAFTSPTLTSKPSKPVLSPESARWSHREPIATATANPVPTTTSETTQPKRARAPSAAEHFAPASVKIAQVTGGRQSRQPSVSYSIASSSSQTKSTRSSTVTDSFRSPSVAGSEHSPSRKAQHVALLQSIAGEIRAKGPPAPLSALTSRIDSPFVVKPPEHVGPLNGYNLNGRSSVQPLGIPPPQLSNGLFGIAPAPNAVPLQGRAPALLRPTATTGPYAHQGPIPVVRPTVPMQRSQLLTLLNGGAPTAPVANVPSTYAPMPPSSSSSMIYPALGPPVPGLESLDSPFVVQAPSVHRPYPQLNYPLPHPHRQLGMGAPPQSTPLGGVPHASSNSQLLSILNQHR